MDAPTLDWLDGVSDLKELAGGFFPIGKRSIISKLHAATLSSLSAPCMTILSISSGTGRCSDLGGRWCVLRGAGLVVAFSQQNASTTSAESEKGFSSWLWGNPDPEPDNRHS